MSDRMDTRDDAEPELLHDDWGRCESCSEIVLIHGKGECLDLGEQVYCPRHARPHMDDEDWELRWGEAMQLLNAIRDDHTKAIKYELRGCPGSFWVVHRDGGYHQWRRCEDEDEQNYLTISESNLVRNIERRYSVGAYVGDPPHLVSAAHAPINASVECDGEVVRVAY